MIFPIFPITDFSHNFPRNILSGNPSKNHKALSEEKSAFILSIVIFLHEDYIIVSQYIC